MNNDLVNLLASVNIPTVMLDSDLSIRRITPTTEDALGILPTDVPTDVGRPLRHVRPKVNVPDQEREMLDVVESLQRRELRVQNGENLGFRLRIAPYRTVDDRIEGVVLVVLDAAGLRKTPAGASRKQKVRAKA